MKERLDSTKMLREPGVNGSGQDVGGVMKLDAADVKAEVKEEDGRKSGDSTPPSRKVPNGDTDVTVVIKTEDNNNKRIKVEKKSDSNGKMENGKPGSVGTESQKSSPQSSTPQHPSSGGTTPATVMPQHGIVTSLEPPFMQQQSEIFVFSTRLANEAADSVRHGHCKSIIQYHVDHPNTKAFLQKNPLKAGSFRQGMMGGMRGQHGPGMMRMSGPSPSSWGPQQPPGMEEMMVSDGMMPNGPYHPGGLGAKAMGGWPVQGCASYHPHSHLPVGPSGYPLSNMMDMENEIMMGGHYNPSNISSSQVPDENLTMEQRQHRSRGLAQLTKIHKMLMGSGGPQDPRHPPMGHENHPGMYPSGPGMMAPQQQAMMSQHPMMSQGGMMPPHGMMSPQHQHMMAQQGMTPYGPRGPPGMGPPGMNGKEQYQAQHDWYQVQREFYIEKQHHIQHMAANRGLLMEQGPPPSYYSSISQKPGRMGGPPSPNMNGMRMPMPQQGPHGPMGPGMDPDGMGIYGGPPDMCRPPHMGMESMPGMNGYPPHMPPQGPLDPAFDSAMTGGMLGPGLPGPGGPRHHGPMHQGHMMGPNGMMTGLKGPNQVTLHRAGNPEQFNPETMGGVVLPVPPQTSTSNSSKPPPSYAQAQKRKRGSDADDSYAKGNLQQTPSPTKIHYHLSQFEGQELTITKQLNSAYVAGGGGSGGAGGGGSGGEEGSGAGSSVSGTPALGSAGGSFNSHTSSPLHGPGSNKGPHSNSSQSSAHMANSPAISTTGPSPHQGPATPHPTPSAAPLSGANMRLTHFDPPSLSNEINSALHTPNPKSSITNITSASLANLAKGVENLSNQMQQNMMQGGPFHSIQVQGQVTGNNSNNNNSSSGSGKTNSGLSTVATTVSSSSTSSSSSSSSSSLSLSSSSLHPASSVSSHMPSSASSSYAGASASPLPVSGSSHSSMNCFNSMQSLNTDSSHVNMPPCNAQHCMGSHLVPGSAGGCARSGMSHIGMMGPIMGGPSPGMGPGPPVTAGMNPVHPHRPSSSSSMPATPPTLAKTQFTSPPLSHPQLSGPGSVPDVASPSFPITSSSNSSVQIQQKGHNTIQYLPANPPSSQPPPAKQRPDFDYNMPRFPSPLPAMDGKNPPSTLQYFPSSSPTGPRPPALSSALSAAAAMGPEFANQATIAMHQSASMMQSSSVSDIQAMQTSGPGMTPSSVGPMVPMDTPSHMRGPHMGGSGPVMGGGHDPMMGMGNLGHMRPGHSPGSMLPIPPGSLECVSPIPGLGGFMNSGPSIEQAQAQAQAHAAMMMQGNTQLPASSPHASIPPCGGLSPHMTPLPCGGPSPHMTPLPCGGPSPHMTPLPCGGPSPHMTPLPCGGPSPHMTPLGPMSSCGDPSPHTGQMGLISGNSMHGPIPPGGVQGHSIHGPSMPGQSPHGPSIHGPSMPGQSPHGPSIHGPSMPGQSPHGPSIHGPSMPGQSPHGPPMPLPPNGPMPGSMSGPSPHGPMPGPMQSPSLHGPLPGPSPHSSMMGPMPPHGHMGHMHNSGMPSGCMPRHPGMGGIRMAGPGMVSMSGQYGLQYPGYQQEYYPSGSARNHPRQMMPGMPGLMGGPGQPYGMMSNMPGPS